MVSLFEDWEKTSKEYAGRATLLLMFQRFGQGKVQATDTESSVFPWRHGAKHFLYVYPERSYQNFADSYDSIAQATYKLLVST